MSVKIILLALETLLLFLFLDLLTNSFANLF